MFRKSSSKFLCFITIFCLIFTLFCGTAFAANNDLTANEFFRTFANAADVDNTKSAIVDTGIVPNATYENIKRNNYVTKADLWYIMPQAYGYNIYNAGTYQQGDLSSYNGRALTTKQTAGRAWAIKNGLASRTDDPFEIVTYNYWDDFISHLRRGDFDTTTVVTGYWQIDNIPRDAITTRSLNAMLEAIPYFPKGLLDDFFKQEMQFNFNPPQNLTINSITLSRGVGYQGAYDPRNRTIYLYTYDKSQVLHEMLHYGLDRYAQEKNIAQSTLNRLYNDEATTRVQNKLDSYADGAYSTSNATEYIVAFATHWRLHSEDRQFFLNNAPETSKFVKAMLESLDNISNYSSRFSNYYNDSYYSSVTSTNTSNNTNGIYYGTGYCKFCGRDVYGKHNTVAGRFWHPECNGVTKYSEINSSSSISSGGIYIECPNGHLSAGNYNPTYNRSWCNTCKQTFQGDYRVSSGTISSSTSSYDPSTGLTVGKSYRRYCDQCNREHDGVVYKGNGWFHCTITNYYFPASNNSYSSNGYYTSSSGTYYTDNYYYNSIGFRCGSCGKVTRFNSTQGYVDEYGYYHPLATNGIYAVTNGGVDGESIYAECGECGEGHFYEYIPDLDLE